MISLPSKGALATLSVEIERELTDQDLLELRNRPTNAPPPLKALSARHRRTALMVAEGKTNQFIAEALGYTPARVGQLKTDPGFQRLVGSYESQIHDGRIEEERRLQGKLALMGEMAIDEVNERLEDPEQIKQISTGELRQIIVTTADRTFAPPKQVDPRKDPPASITLNFGTQLPKPKIINQSGEEE